jgi:hypothetical protein
VSTTGHVLAFAALLLNLLLGGMLVAEFAGVIWRDVFEFVLLGLYLVIVWGVPGSLPRGAREMGTATGAAGRRDTRGVAFEPR